jgi:hypothetical protein
VDQAQEAWNGEGTGLAEPEPPALCVNELDDDELVGSDDEPPPLEPVALVPVDPVAADAARGSMDPAPQAFPAPAVEPVRHGPAIGHGSPEPVRHGLPW